MKHLFIFFCLFGAINSFGIERDMKKEMYKILTTDAPIKFCQPNLLFRECYKVTESECKDIMTISMKACYKTYENKITEDMTIKQLTKQGGEIGECAGMIYEVLLSKVSKRDEECLKNPKWQKMLE